MQKSGRCQIIISIEVKNSSTARLRYSAVFSVIVA